MNTAESSPAWSVISASGMLKAAGIQLRNLKYVLKSKLTNLLTRAPERVGLPLIPLRYHLGKYTLSLIGWSRRRAKATRNAKADKMLMAAEIPISWRDAIFRPLWSRKDLLMNNRTRVRAGQSYTTILCYKSIFNTVLY